MSKTIVTIRKCDVCDAAPAEPWRLVANGEMRDIDVCSEHAQPLTALYKKARPRRKIAPEVVKPRKAGKRTLRAGVGHG